MILHRQSSLKDPACKSCESIWAREILGLQKEWKERIGEEDSRFRGIQLHEPTNCGSRPCGPRGARVVTNGVEGCPKTLAIIPKMSVVQ
jgi:hypothetical protein